MMEVTVRTMLALVVGAVLINACSSQPQVVLPAEPAAAAPEAPRFEYRGIRYQKVTFTGVDLMFRFEALSSDPRPAQILTCPYQFTLTGTEPLSGSAPGAALPGKGKTMIEIPIAVPWPQGTAEIKKFLLAKNAEYQFSITCNVQGPDGGLVLSGADSGALLLPKLPMLTVTGANTERFGDGRFRFNFELAIVNENTFDVPIRSINYKITVEGQQMAEGKLAVGEPIPPSNEASYDIATPRYAGNESKEIKGFLKKSTLAFRLEGSVSTGDLDVPVDQTGTISFFR